MKTPVPDSLFNKIAGSLLYSKETPTELFPCEYYKNDQEIFKNTFFIEYLRWRLLNLVKAKT